MNYPAIGVAVACVLLSCGAAGQPLEFKGLRMGATVSEFKSVAIQDGDLQCLEEDKTGMMSCFGSTSVTYAEQSLLSISGDFLKGRLASISMQAYGGTSGLIRQAIESKYGAATGSRKLRQSNPNGTFYDAQLTEWNLRQGGRIAIQDHPAPHNRVYVTLESPEKRAWFKQVNTATSSAKKDI